MSSTTAHPRIKSVVLDASEPLEALCSNKNFDLVGALSRNVLKVFKIDGLDFETAAELGNRTKRTNTNFSGGISWNPVHENLIAVTSSSGSVIIYDLNHSRENSPQDALNFIDTDGLSNRIHTHKAVATKICFNEFNPHIYVTASKNGKLNLYDCRQHDNGLSFNVRGGSMVRDLQFCFDSNHRDVFMTGDDGSMVRFWDLRKPDVFLKEFHGNTSHMNSATLNPFESKWNLVLTGGRDHHVRIWDWSLESPACVDTLETLSAIARVKWDNVVGHRVATTAVSTDYRLFMWDLRRPYLPVMTFSGHDTNMSDFVFPRNETDQRFITCSKDRKLILHNSVHGKRIVGHELSPISWAIAGPFSDIAVSLPREYEDNKLLAEFDFSRPVEPALYFYTGLQKYLNNVDRFAEYARGYKFVGKNAMEMCLFNAELATEFGDEELTQLWWTVGLIIEAAALFEVPRLWYYKRDKYFDYVENPKVPVKVDEKVDEEVESTTASEHDEVPISGAFSTDFGNAGVASGDFFFGETEFHLGRISEFSAFIDLFARKHKTLMKADFELKEDSDEETDGIPQNQNGQDADEISLEDGEHPSGLFSPVKGVSRSTDIIEESSVRTDAAETDEIDGRSVDGYEDGDRAENADSHWDPAARLRQLLSGYIEVGDCQTLATVALILGRNAAKLFGEDEVINWLLSYIERLHNSGLHVLSTAVAKCSGYDEITKSLQENMHVMFLCGMCGTSAPTGASACAKCGTAFATICAVCDQAVQGVFAQCEECGHGGHQGHLEEWFESFGVCTFPGCEHICAAAKVDPDYQSRRAIIDISSEEEPPSESEESTATSDHDEEEGIQRVEQNPMEKESVSRKSSSVSRKISVEKNLVSTLPANGWKTDENEQRSPPEDTDDDSIVVIAKDDEIENYELNNSVNLEIPLTFCFEDVHGNPYFRTRDGSLMPVRTKTNGALSSEEVKVFYPFRPVDK